MEVTVDSVGWDIGRLGKTGSRLTLLGEARAVNAITYGEDTDGGETQRDTEQCSWQCSYSQDERRKKSEHKKREYSQKGGVWTRIALHHRSQVLRVPAVFPCSTLGVSISSNMTPGSMKIAK